MNENTKEDVVEVLMAIYKIPGQYFIAGIISFAFWNAMRDLTNWAIIFLLFGVFCFVLEIISPILAGKRLYNKFKGWFK
ncbi:hypothetical protein J4409_01205 [Candidatus Woesearchaeota archaeon]|nr:hypothetical protein [Candidatus Woesearchaeota archaeon]